MPDASSVISGRPVLTSRRVGAFPVVAAFGVSREYQRPRHRRLSAPSYSARTARLRPCRRARCRRRRGDAESCGSAVLKPARIPASSRRVRVRDSCGRGRLVVVQLRAVGASARGRVASLVATASSETPSGQLAPTTPTTVARPHRGSGTFHQSAGRGTWAARRRASAPPGSPAVAAMSPRPSVSPAARNALGALRKPPLMELREPPRH